jgi:hypothetical protein
MSLSSWAGGRAVPEGDYMRVAGRRRGREGPIGPSRPRAPPALNLTGASMLEGGIPIVVDGKVVGGIGVSGVTSQQDAQVGQAGIDALK